jgi:hypothetical protein
MTVQHVADFGKYFRMSEYHDYHLISIFPKELLTGGH